MNRARALRAAVAAIVVLVVGGLAVFAMTRQEPVAAASPEPTPTQRPTPSPSPTPSPTPRPTPTPSPTPTPTPTPTPLNEALLNDRITVLIAGLDANDDRRTRTGTFNTDAIVVASVNADHTQISTVALPRDTVDLPLANGAIYTGKVNSIYANYGIAGLRGAMQATYGIEIDYHVLIDMADFGRLVNALDRVKIDVPWHMVDNGIGLNLAPGTQQLDGNDALRYVRTRIDTDYGRAGRQQQMVIAIGRELLSPPEGIDLFGLAGALGSLETDLPLDDLPTLLEIARRSAGAEWVGQVMGPPRFALYQGIQGSRGWIMVPNVAEMRAYVQAVMGD